MSVSELIKELQKIEAQGKGDTNVHTYQDIINNGTLFVSIKTE